MRHLAEGDVSILIDVVLLRYLDRGRWYLPKWEVSLDTNTTLTRYHVQGDGDISDEDLVRSDSGTSQETWILSWEYSPENTFLRGLARGNISLDRARLRVMISEKKRHLARGDVSHERSRSRQWRSFERSRSREMISSKRRDLARGDILRHERKREWLKCAQKPPKIRFWSNPTTAKLWDLS